MEIADKKQWEDKPIFGPCRTSMHSLKCVETCTHKVVSIPILIGPEKCKMRGRKPGWPSWISDQNDFSYQVTLKLPTKFWVNLPFGSEEAQNRFSRDTILAIFDVQVAPMLPTFKSIDPEGCRSRLLKQLLTPPDKQRTTHDGWQTLTDHNSSPWM